MAQLFDDNIKILSDQYNRSKYKDEILKALKCAVEAKQKILHIEQMALKCGMCDDFACDFVCPEETIYIIEVLKLISNE